MQTTILPPRLGQDHLEGLQRLAAPSTVFHVHPRNADKIPCFVSGYKALALSGYEDRGVVLVSDRGAQSHAQRIDGASGVSSKRPCFVPIDGMHPGIRVDVREEGTPHLVRVNVFAIIDEYGVVRTSSGIKDGFPGAAQQAYLFPQGIYHRSSDYALSPEIRQGVTLSGMYGDKSSQLTPNLAGHRDVSGIPIIDLGRGACIARLWG